MAHPFVTANSRVVATNRWSQWAVRMQVQGGRRTYRRRSASLLLVPLVRTIRLAKLAAAKVVALAAL